MTTSKSYLQGVDSYLTLIVEYRDIFNSLIIYPITKTLVMNNTTNTDNFILSRVTTSYTHKGIH